MAEPERRWALIVHGGARTIAPDRIDANRQGCLAAVAAGAAVLRDGGSAVDAAEAAVRVLENDPTFNAGFGSVLNAEGDVEMDAAMMDGASLAVGAVAAVRRIRNPVSVARLMMDELPVLLVSDGAEAFAVERGMALCPPGEMIAPGQGKGHDTVGCVALDADGHVAAATSTGGLSGKHAGRVGDAPIPGSGFYADDALGGTALSGDGESILRTMLAARVMQALETGAAGAAADAGIERLARVGGEAGVIVLSREGRFGVAHNSDHFAVALQASWLGEARSAVHRYEIEELLDG
jgi:beta-aspartyl-peptidase (threonine type)